MGRTHNLITTYICVAIGYVFMLYFHWHSTSLFALFHFLFYPFVLPFYVLVSTGIVIYMHIRESKP